MFEVIRAVNWVFTAAYFVILAGVILSMVRTAVHGDWLYSRPISILINAADGACRPFRRLLDRLNIRTGMIDFSPLLALLALQIAQRVVIGALAQMGGGPL